MGKRNYGISELAYRMGMDEMEMLEQATFDGIAPAICSHCGEIDELEPDADYECPECGIGRMQSCLVMMLMI